MLLALFVWWLIYRYFVDVPDQKRWSPYFILFTPVILYTANQIVPDHWALLFNGLAVLSYLKGVNKNLRSLQLLTGVFLYLAFLARSDSFVLPGAIIMSLWICGYKSRKLLFKHVLFILCSFLPLLVYHVNAVGGIGNFAPMLKAIRAFGRTAPIIDQIKYQVVKAGGMSFFFALLSIFSLFKSKNTRIIFLAVFFVYIPIFTHVLMGYHMVARHTIQGVILIPFLSTVGFLNLTMFLKRWSWSVVVIFAVLCLSIYANLVCANHMTGGVEVKRAYEIASNIENEYSGSILLVADDPTYYFLRFSYPDKSWLYLSYAVGAPENKKHLIEQLENQHGDRYISSREEVLAKNPTHIFYMGRTEQSGLSDDKEIVFKEFSPLGKYKGLPIMELDIQ